jgi:hypothetical protein
MALQIQVHVFEGQYRLWHWKLNATPGRQPMSGRFASKLDDRIFFIEEVLDQWYGSDDTFFKVRADDGNQYILRCDRSIPEGMWTLTSFRRLER